MSQLSQGVRTQIRVLRKQGLSDEQIAEGLGLAITDVAACFSGFAQERAIERIEELMEHDNPMIAMRAAMYIRDDAKGRLDKGLTLANVTQINIDGVFNAMKNAEQQARELYASLQSGGRTEGEAGKVIDAKTVSDPQASAVQ